MMFNLIDYPYLTTAASVFTVVGAAAAQVADQGGPLTWTLGGGGVAIATGCRWAWVQFRKLREERDRLMVRLGQLEQAVKSAGISIPELKI